MSELENLYNEGYYDSDPERKEQIRKIIDYSESSEYIPTYTSPSDTAVVEQKMRDYTGELTQKVEKLAADASPDDDKTPVNSLFMESMRHAVDLAEKNIPKMVEAYKKADLSTPEGIANTVRLSSMLPTGMGTMVYLQMFGGDPNEESKEGALARRRFQQLTGKKYYKEEEIREVQQKSPQEADLIRVRQGDLVDKFVNSWDNIMKGFEGVLDNHVQNISAYPVTDPETGETKKIAGFEGAMAKFKDDPVDFYADALLSGLDSVASVTPLGMTPMAVQLFTDSVELANTDPVAFMALSKAGMSAPPQIAAAARGLKQGGIKGARAARKMKKIEQQQAAKSPADLFESSFTWAENKRNIPLLSQLGSIGLDLQRGGGTGIYGGITALTSTGLPWMFSKDSLMGLPEAIKKRIVKADSEVKASKNEFRDSLLDLAKNNKVDTFAIIREMIQNNQKIMPESFRVVSEVSKILSDTARKTEKLNEKLSNTQLTTAQTRNIQRRIQVQQRIAGELTSALDNLDYAKVDTMRSALLKDWFKKNKKNFKFNKMKDKKNWEQAAQNAIRNTPNSFMNITYDGAPVHPLTFMMSRQRARSFDPTKLAVEVNTPANATPEAVAYLTGHQAEIASMIKLSAMQAMEMATLTDNKGRPLISREAAIMNSLAGYFPEGKVLKAFDKKTKKGKSNQQVMLEGPYEVVENHLKLAREKRDPTHASVRTLDDAIEYAKNDAEAYKLYTQTLLANFETIERAKMWKDVEAALVAEGKIFDTNPNKGRLSDYLTVDKEYVLASPEGGIEFGPLANKYIPRRVYENITRFDRLYGDFRRGLQEANAIFKVGKTTFSLPYYANTAVSLALGQTLFGGRPLSVVSGLKSFVDQDKYYKGMRRAGQIMSSDAIIGLETVSTRSRLRKFFNKMGEKFTKDEQGNNNAQYKSLAKFLEEFSDKFDNPKGAISRNRKTAAISSALGAGAFYAMGGGPGGAFLGGLTGLLMARGKQYAGLFDQGSRVASFKRRINEMADDLSARQRISKERAVDILLDDAEATRQAAKFALDTNLDYQYSPIGVEKISTWPGPFPFIKFAFKSAAMLMAYPYIESGRFVNLTELERAYMNTLPEEDKRMMASLPMIFQGAAVRFGDEVMNLAFQFPFPQGSVYETMAPMMSVAGLLGAETKGGGIPFNEGELMEVAGEDNSVRDSIAMSGWPDALMNIIRDRDRYGKPLSGAEDRVRAVFSSLLPNSVNYNQRLKMAQENFGNVDFTGMNEEELMSAALGLKLRGSTEVIQRNKRKINFAYKKRQDQIEEELDREIEAAEKKKDPEQVMKLKKKAHEVAEKKRQALFKVLFSIREGSTFSIYNKMFGKAIGDIVYDETKK